MQVRCAVLAIVVLAVVLPAPSSAAELVSFQTPTRNIGCAYLKDGPSVSLRCDLLQNDAPIPPRPSDCELDWGIAFSMTERGRPARICAGDTTAGAGAVLAYGKTWRRGGFVCTSQTTGLTCRNTAGRGWTLTRGAQRLF